MAGGAKPVTAPRGVALVTGGARGVGRAIAGALLREGFRVSLTARSAAGAEGAARALEEEVGGEVAGFEGDVRDPEACLRAVEATVESFGGLDVLVNNAGVGRFLPIQDMSLEDWRLQIQTNLDGVFYMSRAALPHLLRSPDPWIINIGSLAGRNPFAGGTAYNASKFGLIGLSEAMMLDLRHQGIRVSLIMPGSVDTEFGDRPEGEKTGWALRPEDVARAVVDLLDYPSRAHPSRLELRPSRPPRKG